MTIERLRAPHALSRAFVRVCRDWLGSSSSSSSSARGTDGGATGGDATVGHVLQAPGEGAGLHWVTIADGMRQSNATCLLRSARAAASRAGGRLRVRTGCRVVRILLEGVTASEAAGEGSAESKAPPRAVGVAVHSAADGVRTELRARREVILCAGAINTPHLMLLSGIGPSDELRKRGVEPTVELGGVGKSLRDVAAVGVASRTAHATLDKQLRSPWTYLRYLLTRHGPLGSNALEASAWISSARLEAEMEGTVEEDKEGGGNGGSGRGDSAQGANDTPPAMQLLVQPLLFPFASLCKFRDFVADLKRGTLQSAFTVHIVLLKPESVGQVVLRSRDPLCPPAIQPNYLGRAGDLKRLVAGVRVVRRLLAKGADALQPAGEILPGEGVTSQAQLEEYVRANACHFNGSLCGSCRMGAGDDPLAVVDEELRVRGIDGLRIADASVFPTLVSGQLNATVTAVAEKAARLILATHAAPTRL